MAKSPSLFNKILPNNTIIVAVSGGADSVYLLHQCLELPSKPHIIVVHINHGMRLFGANRDYNFVKKLAEKYQLPFEGKKIDLKKTPGNLEENARQARYKFFEEIREKYKANWILTGHHLQDQTETLLLNFTRGISFRGMNGIHLINKKKHLLRPLLQTSKKEILAYLKNRQLPFKSDSTNKNTEFRRNFLRHKIIPLFLQLNPNFHQTFTTSAKHLAETQKFTELKAKKWLQKNLSYDTKKQPNFLLESFLKNPLIMQKYIIILLFKSLNSSNITIHQIKEILNTLQLNKANRKKEFGSTFELSIVKTQQSAKRAVVVKKKLNYNKQRQKSSKKS